MYCGVFMYVAVIFPDTSARYMYIFHMFSETMNFSSEWVSKISLKVSVEI